MQELGKLNCKPLRARNDVNVNCWGYRNTYDTFLAEGLAFLFVYIGVDFKLIGFFFFFQQILEQGQNISPNGKTGSIVEVKTIYIRRWSDLTGKWFACAIMGHTIYISM